MARARDWNLGGPPTDRPVTLAPRELPEPPQLPKPVRGRSMTEEDRTISEWIDLAFPHLPAAFRVAVFNWKRTFEPKDSSV